MYSGYMNLIKQGFERRIFTMVTQIVSCAPDIMGGTPVFVGTRVPVQTLLDYLEAGETLEDFLAGFPTVTRGQVIAFLEEAKARMVATVS